MGNGDFGREETEIGVCRGGFAPSVSLRLGHDTALAATGGHSLPCRRFATPTKELFENILAFARGEFAFGKYREVLWNLKNFKKGLFNNTFLKVLGVKPLFQKGLAGSRGCPLAFPHKPKFTDLRKTSFYTDAKIVIRLRRSAKKIKKCTTLGSTLILYHKATLLSIGSKNLML